MRIIRSRPIFKIGKSLTLNNLKKNVCIYIKSTGGITLPLFLRVTCISAPNNKSKVIPSVDLGRTDGHLVDSPEIGTHFSIFPNFIFLTF